MTVHPRKRFPYRLGQVMLASGLFLEHAHMVARDGLLHLLVEVAGVKGFDEKAIGAGLETGCHLFRACIGTDDQNRDILCARATTKAADQVGRVHIGERRIEQDQVKTKCVSLLQAFFLAASNHNMASAGSFEDGSNSFQGGGIVVHHQDVAKAVGIGCNGKRAFGLLVSRRLSD